MHYDKRRENAGAEQDNDNEFMDMKGEVYDDGDQLKLDSQDDEERNLNRDPKDTASEA